MFWVLGLHPFQFQHHIRKLVAPADFGNLLGSLIFHNWSPRKDERSGLVLNIIWYLCVYVCNFIVRAVYIKLNFVFFFIFTLSPSGVSDRQCSNPGKPCACSGGRPASDLAGRQQCRLESSSVVIPMKPTMPVRSYNRGSHYVDSTGNTTYVYTRIPVPLSDPPMPRHFWFVYLKGKSKTNKNK